MIVLREPQVIPISQGGSRRTCGWTFLDRSARNDRSTQRVKWHSRKCSLDQSSTPGFSYRRRAPCGRVD